MFTQPPPCTLVIGNFDGVHAGHQHLLNQAKNIAAQQQLPLHVLTFTPHPRTVLQPNTPHQNLMTDAQKEAALIAYGVAEVHALPFTLELSQYSADKFETKILNQQLHAKHIIIGENFRYGHKASGTPQTLAGNPLFTVHVIPLLSDANGVISSTRLRNQP